MHIYPCMCILTYKCAHTYIHAHLMLHSSHLWFLNFEHLLQLRCWIVRKKKQKQTLSTILNFHSSRPRDSRTSLRRRMNLLIRNEEENILTVSQTYFRSEVTGVTLEKEHFCMYLKQFCLEVLGLWVNMSEAKIWHRGLMMPPQRENTFYISKAHLFSTFEDIYFMSKCLKIREI